MTKTDRSANAPVPLLGEIKMTEAATIIQMPVRDDDVLILHKVMQDLGIKVEYKLTPESRKKVSERLYTKHGWTEQRIANALRVSQDTISRDLSGLTTIVKPPRPKGGRPKGSKPRQRPVEDRARQAVRDKVITGKPVNARKVGEDQGISHVMVEQATAAERARLEVLNELHVDPETLAPSAKAKLEIAKRLMLHRLKTEHANRMSDLDEEVRKRVLKEGKEYLAELQKERDEIREEKKLYQEMRRPLYTIDQYNLIRKCLHQNGVAATAKDFDAAFDLIQKKKLQLTGQK